MSIVNQACQEIARALVQGEAAFFVGAGLSASAGAPLWSDVVSELRKRLNPHTDETTPQLVAQFFRNQHGDHELFLLLRRLLNKGFEPTDVHRLLASLPHRVIVTTNYDDLLERSLKQEGRTVHVICDDREIGLWSEAEDVQVVKIHGNLDQAQSIILSAADYDRFLRRNPALQRKIHDLFSHRTIVFVGYSMRDWNIELIYNTVWHELEQMKRRAFMLTFEQDEHLVREWERRGMCVLRLDPSDRRGKDGAVSDILARIKNHVDQMSRGCDVLIAEDHEESVLTFEMLLEHAFPGIRIEVARDGYEASMRIGKLNPRLLWVDLLIPRVDGIELIRLVRSHPEFDKIKIIVVTAMANEETRKRMLDLGADAFLGKPIEFSAVIAEVSRLLNHEPVAFGSVPAKT
ncbi:MAG TPA: SIR2 family protein [Longimicrobium sp.]